MDKSLFPAESYNHEHLKSSSFADCKENLDVPGTILFLRKSAQPQLSAHTSNKSGLPAKLLPCYADKIKETSE